MYGIYRATFNVSWTIDMRIKDSIYNAARDGDMTSQAHIMKLYKSKILEKFGRSPGFISWDDWHFDIKRLRDASATTRSSRTTRRSTGPSGECRCGEADGRDQCAQCDRGYHCHDSRKGCNLRP